MPYSWPPLKERRASLRAVLKISEDNLIASHSVSARPRLSGDVRAVRAVERLKIMVDGRAPIVMLDVDRNIYSPTL